MKAHAHPTATGPAGTAAKWSSSTRRARRSDAGSWARAGSGSATYIRTSCWNRVPGRDRPREDRPGARRIEDVGAGAVTQVGEQSNNIARNAWLWAELPVTTPATTVDRQGGSGQQSVSFAAGLIAAGVHDGMIGADVERLGREPIGSNVAQVDEFGTRTRPSCSSATSWSCRGSQRR
jgi:acetyl-CoA acetyltransferase